VPSLEGNHVYLRPITPGDYGFIHMEEISGDLGPRWRFRGATPSPEEWAQNTWSNTMVQFLVMGRKTTVPLGYVALHQVDFQDGHAHFAAARLGPDKRTPVFLLGVVLFLHYVFSCWDLRKLYMEVAEYNYSQFASGLNRFFVMEGRLRDHLYAGGRHWDQIVLAIYRDQWAERAAPALELEGL